MQFQTLASLLLCLLIAPALGASVQKQEEGCRRCEYTGMIPCKSHNEELLAHEKEVLFCSAAANCERCGGTLLEDCEQCDGGSDHAIAAARLTEIKAWMQPDALETHLGRALPRIETRAFQLMINTGEMKEGRKRIDEHLIAHRIAQDVERAAVRMDEDFALKPEEYFSKMRMWIWNSPEDHSQAMRQFLGTGSSGDFKMLGRAPVFSVWTEPGLFDSVRSVRSLFAHNATHMLLSNAIFPLWIGDLGGGWLDAAVGHYYEYEIFELTTNYCIEEASASGGFANGVWRAAVRKHLDKNEEPVLPRIFTRNTGGLEPYEQALSWSLFEYLVNKHQPALHDILADFKAKKKLRVILRERLRMDVFSTESAWREWVMSSYPKRGDVLKQSE